MRGSVAEIVDGSIEHLHSAANSFYSKIYTPDSIDDEDIVDLLDHIPSHIKLSHEDQELLEEEFTIEMNCYLHRKGLQNKAGQC